MAGLNNKGILITRAKNQTSALADLVREEGACPILIPTIELGPPESWCSLDAALTAVLTYDWVVFTSVNAVEVYIQRARTLNIRAEPDKIAVIGPATARSVRTAFGRDPDLMPQLAVAERLAEELLQQAPRASFLLVRAAAARDVLPETLAAAGAAVTIAVAYRNVLPSGSITQLRDLFMTDPPDAVTFTSGSTARNLAFLLGTAGLEVPAGTVLASIGPITSAVMREHGFKPTVEADAATISSLVQALLLAFTEKSRSVG